MSDTIKKIADPSMLFLWEINERVKLANKTIINGKSIKAHDKNMLSVDKESLLEIEGETDKYPDTILVWVPNLRKKIEFILGEKDE
jgi:hypothetical protein